MDWILNIGCGSAIFLVLMLGFVVYLRVTEDD